MRDYKHLDRRHSAPPATSSATWCVVLTALTWGLIFWALLIGQSGGFQ